MHGAQLVEVHEDVNNGSEMARFARALMALSCVACARSDSPAEYLSRDRNADSVTVVIPPPDTSTPVWRLPVDSPLLVLGAGDRRETALHSPQPVRLRDGRIIILTNDREWPVRVFDRAGRLLRRFRAGAGPDEFGYGALRGFVFASDSVAIGSFPDGPIRILDSSLHIVRRLSPGAANDRVEPLDVLPDGRWIALRTTATPGLLERMGRSLPGGRRLRWTMWDWVTVSPDRRDVHLLARFPATLSYAQGAPGDPTPLYLFGPGATIAAHDRHLYTAFGHEPMIDVRDTAGRLTRRIRVTLPTVPITGADRQAYADSFVAFARRTGTPDNALLSIRQQLSRAEYAPTVPYFERIVIGDDGRIWVARRHRVAGQRHVFLVFTPHGKLVASATLPWEASLQAAAASEVVITYTDADGDETVRVIPIRGAEVDTSGR